MLRRRLFVDVLLWRRVYANVGDVIVHLGSQRAVSGAWLNECLVYNEEEVLTLVGCFNATKTKDRGKLDCS